MKRYSMAEQQHAASATSLLFAGCAAETASDPALPAPSGGRPFFMPEWKRSELRALFASEPWAREELARIEAAADAGDGFQAAFLCAVRQDDRHVATARHWLLARAEAWEARRGRDLRNPDFFRAGQPALSDVYYDLDITPYVAYDWVYLALDAETRATIEAGFRTHARFKQRSMDRWWQTANLMFKPSFHVAFAGLALADTDLLAWGLRRGPGTPGFHWHSWQGGVFTALNAMLLDDAVWNEAPLYPIFHKVLWCLAELAFYGRLYDGRDWFTARTAGGGSIRGLIDYYVDTAYPIERDAAGHRQIRIATYGDGATGPEGDLYLVDERPGGLSLHEALGACHRVSGDSRYAGFVALIPGYVPHVWGNRPVPETASLPSAPSRVWPGFGLAMLRSDESPAYWTNSDAIAVCQLMTRGYGHNHRDAFSLTLFGAGRLLYPDYNAIQYENPAIGWTQNAVAHTTLVVDEEDMGNAPPMIRHAFSPEVKHLATSATGLYPGLAQTRVLLLTDGYLLDVFATASAVPRLYDYLLHSFGRPRPADPREVLPPVDAPARYTALVDATGAIRDEAWRIDFETGDEPRAAVRVTLAADPATAVTLGHWGGTLAEHVALQSGRALDPLGMLLARRTRRETAFVVTHEPFRPGQTPRVGAVVVLARTADALVVRIDGVGFTDYAAVSFGAQAGGEEHVLRAADGDAFAFRDFGWLRLFAAGSAIARGGWTAFAIAAPIRALQMNGHDETLRTADGRVMYGPAPCQPSVPETAPVEPPFDSAWDHAVLRLPPGGRRSAVLSLTARAATTVSGQVIFDLPAGITVEPAVSAFGPLAPGQTIQVACVFAAAANAVAGEHLIPYHFQVRQDGGERVTAARALKAAVGPTLRSVYAIAGRPVYEILAPRYTVRLDMHHGMPRFLADDDGTVRLLESPLFTFSDGTDPLLFEHTPHAFTWPWPELNPTGLIAHAFDRCRYTVACGADRMDIGMDRDYTTFERTYITVPGGWISPGGPPQWRRVVTCDAASGVGTLLVAAELEFPGGAWNLAFAFTPPQDVTFVGEGLEFTINALTGDRWSMGFCRPGDLDAWCAGGGK